MTIQNAYEINIPSYDTAISNLNFSSVISGVTFKFEFQYFNDQWNGWVTFNDITRLIGVIPYIQNWLYFYDYMIIFDTPLDVIGKLDLINTNIWVLKWV